MRNIAVKLRKKLLSNWIILLRIWEILLRNWGTLLWTWGQFVENANIKKSPNETFWKFSNTVQEVVIVKYCPLDYIFFKHFYRILTFPRLYWQDGLFFESFSLVLPQYWSRSRAEGGRKLRHERRPPYWQTLKGASWKMNE